MIGLRRTIGRLFRVPSPPGRQGSAIVSGTPPHSETSERLVDRVKAELGTRYARDERPTAWEYLAQFALLREDRALAVSLIYEEYCLLEKAGERPDVEEFCRHYPRWRDSLELQLKCHRELNEAVGDMPPLPKPGDHFHGFRIDSILGRGGTSHVYLAYEDAMGGRPVALKVSPDRGPEPEIIGCLDHPRIMPAFSVCRDPARRLRGLCMPYRSGVPLNALIRRSRPLRDSHGASAFWIILAAQRDPGHVSTPSLDWPGWLGFPARGTYEDAGAWIALAIAHAIAHMHSLGIIHCDIKPSNVYVGVCEGPLLFDFGFAQSGRIPNPVLGGTPAYMAPEHLRALVEPGHWAEVGPATDIYAFGLTLAELLLGTLPDTPSASLPAPLAARELLGRRSRPGRPGWMASGLIPPALEEIIRRCLAPSPEARYADARDLVRCLARSLASSTRSTA